MILHWEQLILHYGNDLNRHRDKFRMATQTTYGILCTRFSPDDYCLEASSNYHSEQRLLNTNTWKNHLPQSLAQWETRDHPIVTTVAINRSPCTKCTSLLVAALVELHRQFPLRTEHNRFILACRGVYEDAAMETRTTQNGLLKLHNAGWELCVLQVEDSLPVRGKILLEGIERIAGKGNIRLR